MFDSALVYFATFYLIISPLLIGGFIAYRVYLMKKPEYISANYEGDVFETSLATLLFASLSVGALSFLLFS